MITNRVIQIGFCSFWREKPQHLHPYIVFLTQTVPQEKGQAHFSAALRFLPQEHSPANLQVSAAGSPAPALPKCPSFPTPPPLFIAKPGSF